MPTLRAIPCTLLTLTASVVLAGAATIVNPVSTGTVEYFPNLQVVQMPVGEVIQSTCADTISVNLAWRRGFIEYLVPALPGPKTWRAFLVIQDQGGTYEPPVPPVVHRVLWYRADLTVGPADYDAEATEWATFETDPNEEPGTYRIDVTPLVRKYKGKPLGFRIQMAVDPDGACPFPGGTGFGELFGNPPVIEITN